MNQTDIACYLREILDIYAKHPDGISHAEAMKLFYNNHPEILEDEKEKTRIAIGTNRTNCYRLGWVHFSEQGSWKKGAWHLTDEGKKAILQYPDPVEFIKAAAKKRRELESGKDAYSQTDEVESEQIVLEETASNKASIIFEDAKEEAYAGISEYLQTMNPWVFQEIVADLLVAHGYHVDWIAPPGPDGGCDIVAFSDPLGITHPVIKVQVKRQQAKTGMPVVKSFSANLGKNDAGIFICLGGFTSEAQLWARDCEHNLTLIDLDKFVKLWIANLDNLSDQAKSKFRLEPIYFVRPDNE